MCLPNRISFIQGVERRIEQAKRISLCKAFEVVFSVRFSSLNKCGERGHNTKIGPNNVFIGFSGEINLQKLAHLRN